MRGLAVAAETLKSEMRKVNLSWQSTCEVWRDDSAGRFEEQVIAPIDTAIQQFLQTLAEVDRTFDAALREP